MVRDQDFHGLTLTEIGNTYLPAVRDPLLALNQSTKDLFGPNSKLAILPEYKHSILLEAGDIVAQEIVRFITQLTKAANHSSH